MGCAICLVIPQDRLFHNHLRRQSAAYIQDSDECLTWFKGQYHITNGDDDVVTLGDVYAKFKGDDDSPYANYSKKEKRGVGAKKSFIAQIANHPTLSVYYRKDIYVTLNGVRDHRSNVLIGVAVNAFGLEYNDDGTVEVVSS